MSFPFVDELERRLSSTVLIEWKAHLELSAQEAAAAEAERIRRQRG